MRAAAFALTFAWATVSWASGGQPVFAQTPVPSATEIFDRARAVVAARQLPPFLAYVQDATFERHGRVRLQRDRIVLRSADGKAAVTTLVDPGGSPRAEHRPLVFPASTFGLVPRRPGETPSAFEGADAGEPARAPDAPAVIGRVRAISRAYDVTLVSMTEIEGARVYDLALVPRYDARHNRIREMFVDATTFDPRRIAIEYYAERGPLRSRPTVTFDYAPIDGIWLITHAKLDFVVRFGFFAYGGSGELRIADVTFPPHEPDGLFNNTTPPARVDGAPAASPPPP